MLTLADSSGNVAFQLQIPRSGPEIDPKAEIKFLPLAAVQMVCHHMLQLEPISVIRGHNFTVYSRIFRDCHFILRLPSTHRSSKQKRIQDFRAFAYLDRVRLFLQCRFGCEQLYVALQSFHLRRQLDLDSLLPRLHSSISPCLDGGPLNDQLTHLLGACEVLHVRSDVRSWFRGVLLDALEGDSSSLNLFLFVDGRLLAWTGSSSSAYNLSLWISSLSLSANTTTHITSVGSSGEAYLRKLDGSSMHLVGVSDGSFAGRFDDALSRVLSVDVRPADMMRVSISVFVERYPGLIYFVSRHLESNLVLIPDFAGLWRSSTATGGRLSHILCKSIVELMSLNYCDDEKDMIFVYHKGHAIGYRRYMGIEVWSVWLDVIPTQYAANMLDDLIKSLEFSYTHCTLP